MSQKAGACGILEPSVITVTEDEMKMEETL